MRSPGAAVGRRRGVRGGRFQFGGWLPHNAAKGALLIGSSRQ